MISFFLVTFFAFASVLAYLPLLFPILFVRMFARLMMVCAVFCTARPLGARTTLI